MDLFNESYVCVGFPEYQKIPEEDLKYCYFCPEHNVYFLLKEDYDRITKK